MATVNIKFFRPDLLGEAVATYSENSTVVNEVITSSGTSQETTGSATNGNTHIRVVATGGNVWLTFGEDPTAVTATGHLLIEGIPEVFAVPAGYKVAVID
jgi:hypothetical protein